MLIKLGSGSSPADGRAAFRLPAFMHYEQVGALSVGHRVEVASLNLTRAERALTSVLRPSLQYQTLQAVAAHASTSPMIFPPESIVDCSTARVKLQTEGRWDMLDCFKCL